MCERGATAQSKAGVLEYVLEYVLYVLVDTVSLVELTHSSTSTATFVTVLRHTAGVNPVMTTVRADDSVSNE